MNFLKQKKLWSNELLQYEIGEKIALKTSEPIEEKSSFQQRHFYSSPPKNHGINIITHSGLLWNTVQGEAIEKGNILHRIFEDIYTASDVMGAVDKAMDEGLFLASNKKEMMEVLRSSAMVDCQNILHLL